MESGEDEVVAAAETFAMEREEGVEEAAEGEVENCFLLRGECLGELRGRNGDEGHCLVDMVLDYDVGLRDSN